MIGVSASVIFPCTCTIKVHKKFFISSATGSPGWSQKKGCKMVACVYMCVCYRIFFNNIPLTMNWNQLHTATVFLLTSNVQSIKKQLYQMQLLSLFLLLFHFTGHFPGGPGSSSCPLVFFLHLFQQRTFTDKQHRFSMGWLPFLSPNQQHQCTESNTNRFIDWVVVLRPARHKIGHFGDVPQANLMAWYGKTKPNTTKAHIHQSKQMYYNAKYTR